MLWKDVLVQCHVADSTLARPVADTFAIDPQAVLIVDATEDILAMQRDDALVVVERRPLEGACKLVLSLFLRDVMLERDVDSRSATLEALGRLADRLGCTVLTGDESVDPTAWLVIRSSGAMEPVTLDVERLDRDGFVAAPTPRSSRSASVA